MKKVERRKTTLIQKDVQIGFLKLISILYLFVFLTVSFFWLGLLMLVLKQAEIDFSILKETISVNLQYFSVTLTVQILAMVFIIYFMFVRFTHKVCGPIFSIERTVKKMNEQKILSSIHIRQDDFYQDFVKNLNVLIQNISDYKKQTSEDENK